MPQLRSFSAFGSTPNVGSAYVGGAGVGQRIQETQINAATQRAQIANQYAIAEMENASKRAALAQKALSDAQELEVQKAYQQSQLALKGRELDLSEQGYNLKSDEASRQFMAQEQMRRGVVDALAQNPEMDPGTAFRKQASIWGVQAGAPGSVMGDIINSSPGGVNSSMGMPKAVQLEGAEDGTQVAQLSPNRWAFVPKTATQPTEAAPAPGTGGSMLKWGNRLFANPEYQQLNKDKARIEKMLEGPDMELNRRALTKPEEKRTSRDAVLISEYRNKQAELKAIQDKIAAFSSKPSAGGGTTNQIGRFKVIYNP